MALTTSQLRAAWSPACQDKGDPYRAAYAALDAAFEAHDYRPRAGVTGAYNCRSITGGSGYSLHAYGPAKPYAFWTGVKIATSLAVDINWDKNPYGPRLVTDMPRAMIDDILAIRTNSGAQVWGWGGNYRGNKDAMHFEIVCTPADLATGITEGDDLMGEQADRIEANQLREAAADKQRHDRIVDLLNQVNRGHVWQMRQAGLSDEEIRRILGKKKLPAA